MRLKILVDFSTNKYHVYLSCELLRNPLATGGGSSEATELSPLTLTEVMLCRRELNGR